jgi:hypothetical protein
LKPLAPLYVSAVDSGNLAAHLMTLRPGLLALADDRIIEPRWFEGLGDTLRTLAEATGGAAPASLARLRSDLDTAYDAWPATLAIARQWLTRIEARIAEVTEAIARTPAADAAFWVDALARQCRAMQEELTNLAPGMKGEIPTLRELAALEAQSPHVGASRPATERMAAIERLALQCTELSRMEYDFLYDRARHLLTIGYNVAERRCDAKLLRPARLRSAARELRGDLPGRIAAGELVRARALAHERGRPIGAAVLERLDVRVPDADAGDAHVRQHAARSNVPRDGRAADRVRQAARRALGHLGVRLQLGRCGPQLPVPAPSACRGWG